jgi:predicted DNA-binding transcriptional regulator AlpA
MLRLVPRKTAASGKQDEPRGKSELLAAARKRAEADWRAVFARILELSRAEQEALRLELNQYLAEPGVERTALEIQEEARAAAIAGFREVAAAVGAPTNKRMSPQRFDAAAESVGSEWRSGRIVRIWEKWGFAMRKIEALWTPLTPAQRAIRHRNAKAMSRRTIDDYFASVAAWLATDPPETSIDAYDAWGVRANDGLPPEELPHVKSKSVRANTGLGWAAILAVVRGELSFEDQIAKEIEAMLTVSGPLDLVALRYISLTLECSRDEAVKHTERPGFPAWAADLEGVRAWLRTDVEAHVAGRALPEREPGFAQVELLTRRDAAALVGLTPSTLKFYVGMKDWHKAPPPSGRVGNGGWYWLPADVTAWQERNRLNLLSGKKASPRAALPEDFLSATEIASRLGLKRATMLRLVRTDGWHAVPPPSGKHQSSYFWKPKDVELWEKRRAKKGLQDPVYLAELCEILGVHRTTMNEWLKHKSWDRIPRPAGRFGGGRSAAIYWARADVEDFKARQLQDGPQDPVETREMLSLLGIARKTLWRWLAAEKYDRVPRPAGRLAPGSYSPPYWERAVVEAFMAQQDREAPQNPMGLDELVETVGMNETTFRKHLAQENYELVPPPAGRLNTGRSPLYWERAEVEAWQARHREPADEQIAP